MSKIGVHLNDKGRWTAAICKDYKHVDLGEFEDPTAASAAYDRASETIGGESAPEKLWKATFDKDKDKNRGRQWTRDLDLHLGEMFDAGDSIRSIAHKMGRTRLSIIARLEAVRPDYIRTRLIAALGSDERAVAIADSVCDTL